MYLDGTSVYFLRSGAGGPIKIGCSSSVEDRADQLQTGNPKELVLLGTVPPGKLESDGRALESELKEKFSAFWIRGEWFRASSELLSWITENCVLHLSADDYLFSVVFEPEGDDEE